MQVSISFVLKLTGSLVLTQLRTGPEKYRFSVPIPNHKCSMGYLKAQY